MTGPPGPPARLPAALTALLRGVVDYAGLFPPACQSMPEAVRAYADYRESPEQWMLGRFVVPAARLEEFEDAGGGILPRTAAASWALSALVGADVEVDASSVDHFNDRHRDARRGAVHVDTVETRPAGADEIRAADPFIGGYDVYVELPLADDPAPLLDAVAEVSAKAKMRTGGVTPDAIPPARHVVRFMRRCIERGIPFKATAGLHHPLRALYPLTYELHAPEGTMHGFLNVLAAAAFMAAPPGIDDETAVAMLEERDPSAFRFDGEGLRWRDAAVSADGIAAARHTVGSIGSCSFREPVHDLQRLGLL